jgi:hypothetical protein
VKDICRFIHGKIGPGSDFASKYIAGEKCLKLHPSENRIIIMNHPELYQRSFTRWRLHLCAAACCLLILVLPGCRRDGPEVVPVKGVVTFGGGSWAKPGTLYFTVESSPSGMPHRPAYGAFDTDGNITVTTFREGDGLIPGKYRIAVECWDIPPKMGSPMPPKSYVPARFASPTSSGLTVVAESGQREVELNLDIPKK